MHNTDCLINRDTYSFVIFLLFCRVNDTAKLKREDWDHMVITPIQFHGHVIRKLSGWCSVVPDFTIDAELPSLEVQLGPGDYSAIFSLISSLGDGKPTTPPSDKGEDKGEGDGGGEKEEEDLKERTPHDTRDAASSSYVKLVMKFKMKEVRGVDSIVSCQLHVSWYMYMLYT